MSRKTRAPSLFGLEPLSARQKTRLRRLFRRLLHRLPRSLRLPGRQTAGYRHPFESLATQGFRNHRKGERSEPRLEDSAKRTAEPKPKTDRRSGLGRNTCCWFRIDNRRAAALRYLWDFFGSLNRPAFFRQKAGRSFFAPALAQPSPGPHQPHPAGASNCFADPSPGLLRSSISSWMY